MRLVTYQKEENIRLAALLDDRIVDIHLAYQAWCHHAGKTDKPGKDEIEFPPSMIALLRGEATLMETVYKVIVFIQEQFNSSGHLPSNMQYITCMLDEVTLRSPIIHPGKMICVGMNYPSPASPSDSAPNYPVLFLKPASTLTGHVQPIVIPRVSQDVFCEGELAVVIGRRGKHIPPEEALSFVAGYTIANDVGARDLEQRSSQWTTGKLPDTFCPMGPALVTRDEIPDPNALTIKTHLNDQLVQHGNTQDMHFDVPYLISYISGIATLHPGDIILTGSPKAVGDRPAPKVTLHPGDTITIEIDNLDTLINTTFAEE